MGWSFLRSASFKDFRGITVRRPGAAIVPSDATAGLWWLPVVSSLALHIQKGLDIWKSGTSDLNAWVGLFGEFAELMGYQARVGELFKKLYTNSLHGDADCGGLLAYGYYSGENMRQWVCP